MTRCGCSEVPPYGHRDCATRVFLVCEIRQFEPSQGAKTERLLNSQRAIEISVYVVRAFVRLRETLSANEELAVKLGELERKIDTHDQAIAEILEAIRQLMNPPGPKRRGIGFTADLDPKT